MRQPPVNSSRACIKPLRSWYENIQTPLCSCKQKRISLRSWRLGVRQRISRSAPSNVILILCHCETPDVLPGVVAISRQLQPNLHSTKSLRFSRLEIAALTAFARNDTRFGVLRRSTRPFHVIARRRTPYPASWQPPVNSSRARIKSSRSWYENIHTPLCSCKQKRISLRPWRLGVRQRISRSAPSNVILILCHCETPDALPGVVAISRQLQPNLHSTKSLRFSRLKIAALTMFARNDTRFGVLRRSTRPLPCHCETPDVLPGVVAISRQLQPGPH